MSAFGESGWRDIFRVRVADDAVGGNGYAKLGGFIPRWSTTPTFGFKHVWLRFDRDLLSSRIANLLLLPVAAGIAMAAVGAGRSRRDQHLIRLDRFSYGYILRSQWRSFGSH